MDEARLRAILPAVPTLQQDEPATVHGMVIGVVPHLDPSISQLRTIQQAIQRGQRIDLGNLEAPGDLESVLRDQEVMYVVVGKWPPDPASGLRFRGIPELAGSSAPGRNLPEGTSINMVIGPWPPAITQQAECSLCGRKV